MLVNADFSERVVITPDQHEWMPSPMPGVERMMLDRIGVEVARATSLVRYAPNSEFSAHTHGGGEEILVLEGEFADEHGVYPKGTYLRNPVGTSHSPKIGDEGALIFVKLHQFQDDDSVQIVANTHELPWDKGSVEGIEIMELHNYGAEYVALVKWAPFTEFTKHQHWGGEEVLVLEGTLFDEQGTYPEGTWMRCPHLSSHTPYTKEDGALILLKTGHLPEEDIVPQDLIMSA